MSRHPQRPELVHDRDPLTAAKAIAVAFTWAVKGRNAPEVRRLTQDLDRRGVEALAVVLAEGISPGSLQLLQVTKARDDDDKRSA